MDEDKKNDLLRSLKPVAFILGIGFVVFGLFRFIAQNDPIRFGEDALLGAGLGIALYALSSFAAPKEEKDED